MSVLIKGMGMPKKCGECDIYVCYRTWNGDPGDEFCGMKKENVSYKTKPDWCPLSEVPEQKKGEWTTDGHCPFCGEHAPYWPMASTYHKSNFCPNCGSDMRGEHE